MAAHLTAELRAWAEVFCHSLIRVNPCENPVQASGILLRTNNGGLERLTVAPAWSNFRFIQGLFRFIQGLFCSLNVLFQRRYVEFTRKTKGV